MAFHSFIILYAHIGRSIRAIVHTLAQWVFESLMILYAVVIGMGFVFFAIGHIVSVAEVCAAAMG